MYTRSNSNPQSHATSLNSLNFNVSSVANDEYIRAVGNKLAELSPIHATPLYEERKVSNNNGQYYQPKAKGQAKQCLDLLAVSYQNKIDLGALLIKEYNESGLSMKDYINRSSLSQELGHQSAMFMKFMEMYCKYIEKAIPKSRSQLPARFNYFDDDINTILEYYAEINECIGHYDVFKARPSTQFDVYFASPASRGDFDNLYIKGMIKSAPNCRLNGDSALKEIYSLLNYENTKKTMDSPDTANTESCNKRMILFIVRKSYNHTNNDILYLFEQDLDVDLCGNPGYQYNEMLWKLNTKRDILKNAVNIDDKLSLSYHLHSDNTCKSYVYYNGFGQRISKRSILDNWPILFKPERNEISTAILNKFQLQKGGFCDFMQRDNTNSLEFGQYIFGVRYYVQPYTKSRRHILTFPKNVLQDRLDQIAEFDEQQQLYYYLTWTCKMQLIDAEFLEYTFNRNNSAKVAVFNTELHDKLTGNELYIIAVLNDQIGGVYDRSRPTWQMSDFMDAHHIYQVYGIASNDLPVGSRKQRNYFQHEIYQNQQKLASPVYVRNWNRVKKVFSQQFRHENTPRMSDFDLNGAIKHAINDIRNQQSELIPILNIDLKQNKISVNSLIPVYVKNRWIAVEYRTQKMKPYKTVIQALYIDSQDIINKAALIHPNAVYSMKWLKGDSSIITNNNNNNDSHPSLENNDSEPFSIISNCSVITSSSMSTTGYTIVDPGNESLLQQQQQQIAQLSNQNQQKDQAMRQLQQEILRLKDEIKKKDQSLRRIAEQFKATQAMNTLFLQQQAMNQRTMQYPIPAPPTNLNIQVPPNRFPLLPDVLRVQTQNNQNRLATLAIPSIPSTPISWVPSIPISTPNQFRTSPTVSPPNTVSGFPNIPPIPPLNTNLSNHSLNGTNNTNPMLLTNNSISNIIQNN